MSAATVSAMPTITVSLPQSYVNNRLSDITPVQQMVSSCSGAILTSLFMTPLDVVKIRLQAQRKPLRSQSYFIYSNGLMDCLCVCSHCNEINSDNGSRRTAAASDIRHSHRQRPASHFLGVQDAFVKIARNEGITKLWSGLPPTLIQSVPATVVYFTVYDRLKYMLGYDEANPSTRYIPMVAGSCARLLSVTLMSPIELIRTKMQSNPLSYRQLGVAVRISIANNGMLSIMRGLGPSLLRDVPFSAFYWFSYEMCKARQLHDTGDTDLSIVHSFFCGAISGMIAAVITLPFDVIKTHRQIELGEAFVSGGQKPVTSTWGLIVQLYQHEGFAALYAGIVPRVMKVAPACAIMISTYEYGKSFFHHRNLLAADVDAAS
jgi:solute carrier family 25 protein 39/40